MGIESGIITKSVELGKNIQINVDFNNAADISTALNSLTGKGILQVLTDEEALAVTKLSAVLNEALMKYHKEFNVDNEFIGEQ